MNLPPLQSIVALETLERLGSVKATAEALKLTQSAVSHKLKALQIRVGFPLTTAHGRGVVLTSQARQYVHSIRPALQALGDAHLNVSTISGPLTISSVPGFAAYWLAPRLTEFRHIFPEIDLRLRTHRDAPPRPDIDVQIDFTSADPPNAIPLIKVRFFPVCSPAYAHANPLPRRVSHLKPSHLLHLSTYADWETWFSTQNTTLDTPTKGVLFDDVQTMLAAAHANQGICLGDHLTCETALRDGTLIAPYATEINADKAYVLTRGQTGATASSVAFENWLTDQIKNYLDNNATGASSALT